jgi:hypothetical protein
MLHQGCRAEGNNEDDDHKKQTSSGCFNLDYLIHPKKYDQAQNEPIATWRDSFSRSVSPFSQHRSQGAFLITSMFVIRSSLRFKDVDL